MTNETIDTAALAEEIATEIEVDLLGRPGKGVMLCLSGAQARALAALLRGVVDGPKVRPLEWVKDDAGHSAEMPFGEYTCDGDEDETVASFPWVCSSPDEIMGHFETLDAAKSAAQADYEHRIRSALVFPSPPLSTTKEG